MEEFVKTYLLNPTVGRIVAALLAVVLVVVVVRFVKKALGRYITDTNSRYRARKAVTFFGYLLAATVLIFIYSDKLGNITVALGVAGAGIAFALQEVIASVAGWFAIAFGNFYKTGDRVQLGGIKGDVIDIGVLRTTLMEVGDWVKGDLYNGRVVRVSNSFVFKEPVFNYSGDFPFLWDEIIVPIRHDSDLKQARQILTDVSDALLSDYSRQAQIAWDELVQRYPIENASVKPLITMIADENWVTYTVRYVVEFKSRRLTKDALFEKVLADIAATKGKVNVATAAMEVTMIKKGN